MWSNLSTLAQKAKEAAAIIEEQINDSIGLGEGSGDDDFDASSSSSKGVARTRDVKDGSGGDDDTNTSVGWEKCDGDGDISSEDGEVGEDTKNDGKEKPQLMSFVDLKSAVDAIPKSITGEPESNSDLLVALARIDALEKQVNALKDELVAARETSENYHATNLLLEQQVKELQEENTNLKENKQSSCNDAGSKE